MGLVSIINKDVMAENESRRAIVALRILYLIVFVAFVLDVTSAGLAVFLAFKFRILFFFAMIIIFFVMTYHTKTRTSLLFSYLFLFSWAVSMMPCFGWSAGMQNYYIIVLMLCFFASHSRLLYKFIYAGCVLVFRIVTIGIFGGIKPIVPVSVLSDKLLQVINITAVFLSIIFISYVFSQKNNDAENKLMKYNDKLKREANTDQLTGLFNRRRAKEYMSDYAESSEIMALSVAIGDIDFFKKVNDTYGHDAGDEVLKAVAQIMVSSCRSESFIARWGGEEFLLMFPNCNGDDAFIILERIRKTIESSSIKVGDQEIKITMTFGLTEFSYNKGGEFAIKEADEKLYMGKQNGRNQVVY